MSHRFLYLFLPLVVLLCSCGPFWRSPAYVTDFEPVTAHEPILTLDQYGERADTHARPYIVRVSAQEGGVLLFGAEHTKDPGDPQLLKIRQLWNEFRPTVALVEGRLGFLFRWTTDPTERYGEGGFTLDLAKGDDIPAYTWDPPIEMEVASVLKKFPKKRVALYYVLRPYVGKTRFGKPDDPDAIVESSRRSRTTIPGLEGSLRDLAEIDSLWQADFQGIKDWRVTSDEYGWPGYLDQIAKQAGAYRDEHFFQVIIHFVRRGERVFAVCGSSHAVMLEQAVTAAVSDQIPNIDNGQTSSKSKASQGH